MNSLLFTLLGSCEFLHDLAAFPGFDLFPCVFHKSGESSGQFVNALQLPSCNRFGRNRFCANPDGGRPRQNETSRCLVIHSPLRQLMESEVKMRAAL